MNSRRDIVRKLKESGGSNGRFNVTRCGRHGLLPDLAGRGGPGPTRRGPQGGPGLPVGGLQRPAPAGAAVLPLAPDVPRPGRVGRHRLTYEYLAAMLRARRASVTDALGPLQDAGLVRSHRGVITILDKAGLEARTCECYFIVRARYAALLGGASRGLDAIGENPHRGHTRCKPDMTRDAAT